MLSFPPFLKGLYKNGVLLFFIRNCGIYLAIGLIWSIFWSCGTFIGWIYASVLLNSQFYRVYLNCEPAHLVSVLANQVYPLHFPLHNTTPNIPANEESSKSVIFWLKLLKVKAWNRKMKNDNTANSNGMKQCPRFATELFSIGLYWPKDISPGSCFLVFISMWARKFVDKRVLNGKGLD